MLAYEPKDSGLYLHGINFNSAAELHTLPSTTVQSVAKYWGMHPTDFVVFDTIDQVKEVAKEIDTDGKFRGRAMEGVVIRCRRKDRDFLFKIKNDHYLIYREWREVTKQILHVDANGKAQLKPNATVKLEKCKYGKTKDYLTWVRKRIVDHPEWFTEYKQNKGIIFVREQFERYWETR